MASLSPVVCHIASKSSDDTSVFLDAPLLPTQTLGSGVQMTYVYSAPPNFSLADGTDLKYHESAPTTGMLRSFPAAGGLSTVVIDIEPNQTGDETPMHRTQTLDHIIVTEGELELLLDSGEKRLVKAGEIVLQRQPMHTWRNPSRTKGARMIAIALGSAGAVAGAMEFEQAKV